MKPKRITITIFIATATLLFIVFFVVPRYNEFMSLRQKLGEKQAEFDGKYNYYTEIYQKMRELEANKESLDKIDSALPNNFYFGDLVYALQKKSSENGMVIKNLFLVKDSLLDPKENIKEISLSVNLLGTYSALKNFMHSLEKSARLFEIPTVTFSSLSSLPPSTAPQSQIYSFNLALKTYSY